MNFESYSIEHHQYLEKTQLGRRLELMRKIHQAEMEEIPVPTFGLRADVAGLLRRAADRLDRPTRRRALRAG